MILAMAREAFPRYEFMGIYRYQVFQQTGEKLELQAVRKRPGLPDILPVEMFPGVAGAFAELQPDCTVLVQFLDGDPSLPVVTGYAPKSEGQLHYANNLTINAITQVDIGITTREPVVKWPGVSAWASQAIAAYNGDKADITAAMLLAQPGGGVTYVPATASPDEPPGFTESTKVRVE